MKCGENTVKLKLALAAFAVALIACVGTIPVEVEANSIESVKLSGAPLDF